MKKKILTLLMFVGIIFIATSCAKEEVAVSEPISGKINAIIKIKDMGEIKLELDADVAPITVANFVKLANSGFYEGLSFFSAKEDFGIEGGDPNGDGTGGSQEKIKGEFSSNGVENNISHERGVISMIRSEDMNSASSQFLILSKDSKELDGEYAAFGHVTEGMKIVDEIVKKYAPKDKESDGLIVDKAKQPVIENVQILYTGKINAEINVKNMGIIKLELDADTAPITVTNFVNLTRDGFYNGLTFHRVIDGFMIQGGDPLANGTGGSDKTIKGEFSKNNVKNDISHKRGVISMARSKDMNSASSQFFIVHKDSPHLDGEYAAFGHVTEGMDIVDKIAENYTPSDSSLNGLIVEKSKQPVIKYIIITK